MRPLEKHTKKLCKECFTTNPLQDVSRVSHRQRQSEPAGDTQTEIERIDRLKQPVFNKYYIMRECLAAAAAAGAEEKGGE